MISLEPWNAAIEPVNRCFGQHLAEFPLAMPLSR